MVRFLFSGGRVRMGKEVKLAEKTTLSYSFYLTNPTNTNKQKTKLTKTITSQPLYTHIWFVQAKLN